jgi:hypothetical protein
VRLAGVNEIFDYNRAYSARRDIPLVDQTKIQSEEVINNGINNSEETLLSGNNESNRDLLSTREVIDYAVNSDMNKSKELIGLTKDISQLDAESAVSDMRRDSILQEYQYFVSNYASADGAVIRK